MMRRIPALAPAKNVAKQECHRAVFFASPLVVWLVLLAVWVTSFNLRGQGIAPDTLRWDNPPSGAMVGAPVAVSLEALDVTGKVDAAFNGKVGVTAVTRTAPPGVLISEVAARSARAVELCNLSETLVAMSGWRIIFYDAANWPAPRTTFVIPPGTFCAPHEVFQISSGGTAPGSYPEFFLGTDLLWFSSAPDNPIAVLLCDNAGKVLDFFCACGGYPMLIESPTPIPAGFWQGLPAPASSNASRSYQRVGGLDHDNAADWLATNATLGVLNAGVRLPFSAPVRKLDVSPTEVQFSQGRWQGSVTFSEPATLVWLRAEDGAGLVGESGPFNVAAGPPLILELPTGGSEATAGALGTGQVSLREALTTNLTVTLSVDVEGEISLPASVVLVAGETSGTFTVTNLDDALLDGTRHVTVTASAPGFAGGSGVVTNADNELGALAVTLPGSAREGNGVLRAAGRVQVNVPVGIDFKVLLNSSNTNEVRVPANVFIPAGQTSAYFNVTIIDDAYLDGNQITTIEASAAGAAGGSAQMAVDDNESPTLLLGLSSPVEEGQGIVSNGVRVTLGGLAASNVMVSLTSLNPARLQVPPAILVPAGQKSALTYFTLPDDTSTNEQEIRGRWR